MASVSIALLPSSATHNMVLQPTPGSFLKPLPLRHSRFLFSAKPKSRLQLQASLRERAVSGLTAAALTASMVIPQVAEVAESDITSSLKNFLLGIVAGGGVLGVIVGAAIGVANFDPVKRS